MATIVHRSSDASFDAEAVNQLASTLRGELVQPADAHYDQARTLYNAMIDKHPALIVQAADVADVIETVNFARTHRIDIAVRGGGHNGPGLGSVDNGIVLDLGNMRGVRVDPVARTARVEGGARWGDVDHATHAFGLATPSGIISTTGVGGLTLGGGVGHLSRKYGLSIDNLLAADVVLADGSLVTASADEHPDLFWALRGGGGNFGVVTSFLFRLHPVDTVIAGPVFWDLSETAEVMRWYRDFIKEAPEDLNGFFAFLVVPPGPPFPEELYMKNVAGIVWSYTGPKEKFDDVFAPVLKVGNPLLNGVQEMPYPMLQGAFDALCPPGQHWYWKADFVRDLTDEAIERHVEFGSKVPGVPSTMHLYPINGAVHRVGQNDTAFSYRDVTWASVMAGVGPEAADVPTTSAWARDYWEALHPYSAGGAYVNMMMEEGNDRIRASYRDNYDRLRAVKAVYDPTNLFHINQNIDPASG
jgi:FAD/FMN-containing dehydrogenase